MTRIRFLAALQCSILTSIMANASIVPPPSSVYREFTVEMTGHDWRVTDPDVEFEQGKVFLPNPELIIHDVDLTGATRVELIIDYWAGHPGTTNPRIRIS